MIRAGTLIPSEIIEMHRLLGIYDATSYLRVGIAHGALPLHAIEVSGQWCLQRWSAGGYQHLAYGSLDEVLQWANAEYQVLNLVQSPFDTWVPRTTTRCVRRALEQMRLEWAGRG